MSNLKVIHYCGMGINYMLAGWPVCGSGEFAIRVKREGNQTDEINSVTCKKCIKKMQDNKLL